ncbi:MAG: hypothetical protein L6R42_009634, partial [Xanthoria sp. 1 TBL-2021]
PQNDPTLRIESVRAADEAAKPAEAGTPSTTEAAHGSSSAYAVILGALHGNDAVQDSHAHGSSSAYAVILGALHGNDAVHESHNVFVETSALVYLNGQLLLGELTDLFETFARVLSLGSQLVLGEPINLVQTFAAVLFLGGQLLLGGMGDSRELLLSLVIDFGNPGGGCLTLTSINSILTSLDLQARRIRKLSYLFNDDHGFFSGFVGMGDNEVDGRSISLILMMSS